MALFEGAAAQYCFRLPNIVKQHFRHAVRHPNSLVLGPRRYCFTMIFLSLVCAKFAHLHAHWSSLPLVKLFVWGPTFFLQDFVLIFLARLLCRDVRWKSVRILAAVLVVLMSISLSVMASFNISFYFVTGAEIHWRRAHFFHRDAAAIRTLLTGLAGFLFVEGFLLTISWFVSPYLYDGTQIVLKILGSSVEQAACFFFPRKFRRDTDRNFVLGTFGSHNHDEEAIRGEDEDDAAPFLLDSGSRSGSPSSSSSGRRLSTTSLRKRVVVLTPILLTLFLEYVRPSGSAYSFLSCTLPLSPFFTGPKRQEFGIDATGLTSDRYAWLSTNLTALAEPTALHSLPNDGRLAGFEDWFSSGENEHSRSRLHYNLKKDPLGMSNLQNDIVDPLRAALHNGNIKIKHVIVVKMESTRADVFPINKNSLTYKRIAKSHPGRNIPMPVKRRLADLTRTAAWLTGATTGFESEHHRSMPKPPYGSIHATNAFTTSTYTLKSIVGSLCGLSPLVADFNREYENHIYQPCLPHILDLFNRQQPNDSSTSNHPDDFTAWPWHSAWMQSVTGRFDNQDELTTLLGFQQSTTRETLENPASKHFPPLSPLLNYYGYQDRELREYLVDSLSEAERDHKRLFLTYLTGITHHPWAIPDHETEEFTGPRHWHGMNDKINRYLNSIGYIDKWLGEVLQILEDTGIANETLLVMAGDHGISLPHDGGITPYDGPNVGNFHIPLVFAHPHIPQFTVNAPITSKTILPSVLDLLVESSSLDEKASQTAKELLPLYEAQSILRPVVQEVNGIADWQFTVMNSGGTWLALRSSVAPFRLVIPLIADMEWRFTDVRRDPHENRPITNFDLRELAHMVERWYGPIAGPEVVRWIADATHVAQWWVSENWRRWEYSPKVEKLKV